jgi:hypothetical protein
VKALVNGVTAKGGSGASGSPIVANGMVFIGSGYPGFQGGQPGNVLLAFAPAVRLDALGLYSGYEEQAGVGGVSTKSAALQQYLRGTQMTDKTGKVQFRTIFPSWYGGRTPHVHFKVFLSGNEVVASQIFFPEEINKEVFSQWDPYKQHTSKRTTFNDNDRIRQGIYSNVTRQNRSYTATAVLVVAQRL